MAKTANSSRDPRYERSDVNIRAIVYAGFGIAVTVVTIALAVRVAVSRLDIPAPDGNPGGVQAASPALESAPQDDLQAFIQAKEKPLHQYAWVDRERGIVRIPIERAMQLLVEESASPPPSRKRSP